MPNAVSDPASDIRERGHRERGQVTENGVSTENGVRTNLTLVADARVCLRRPHAQGRERSRFGPIPTEIEHVDRLWPELGRPPYPCRISALARSTV